MTEDGRVKLLSSIFSVIMCDLRKNRIREWMVLGEEKNNEASIFWVEMKGIKQTYVINVFTKISMPGDNFNG